MNIEYKTFLETKEYVLKIKHIEIKLKKKTEIFIDTSVFGLPPYFENWSGDPQEISEKSLELIMSIVGVCHWDLEHITEHHYVEMQELIGCGLLILKEGQNV